MTPTGSIAALLFVVAALAVVLAMAWLLLKGLAALGQRGSAQALLQIKATLPLGSRERLIVLEYKDSEYLLGVASGNVSLIDKQTLSHDDTPASKHT